VTKQNNNFVIMGLPRTGTCALRHSLINSGLKVHPGEPYFATDVAIEGASYRHDHIAFSKKLFSSYDGFKIIVGHSEQVLDMCEQNNAKLILLKRNNFLAFLASYYILVSGKHNFSALGLEKDVPHKRYRQTSSKIVTESFSTWTSTGNEVVYKPLPFMNYSVDKFLYYNYMIDNVYNQHKNYLTTVDFEDVTKGVSDLENYFDRPINLDITSNTTLSKYFVNHEEFKEDIERRIKLILGH